MLHHSLAQQETLPVTKRLPVTIFLSKGTRKMHIDSNQEAKLNAFGIFYFVELIIVYTSSYCFDKLLTIRRLVWCQK